MGLEFSNNKTNEGKLMTKREKRIEEEYNRIAPLFDEVQINKRTVVQGLIESAAFLKIQLEDYQDDLNKNGYTDEFRQSEKLSSYERERSTARLYNATVKNYQAMIRQLVDLIPDEQKKKAEDEIMAWVRGEV